MTSYEAVQADVGHNTGGAKQGWGVTPPPPLHYTSLPYGGGFAFFSFARKLYEKIRIKTLYSKHGG